MKKLSIIRTVLTICVFISKMGYSQQVDTTEFKKALGMSFDDLLNVKIVTASKTLRLSKEITQKVDIITSKQINQTVSGKGNISELIQYLPGASVKVLSRNDANWGAYGGIGPKYNTYMAQGLPIDAFMDPQSLDALAVDHIEIQRGPASILYPNYLSQDFAGNQSPLAGTVNLILKENIERPQTMASVSYGTYNTLNSQLYHENKVKNMHLFGGISYENSDYTDYGSANSWLNMMNNPEYQKTKGFLGVTYYLGNKEDHKIIFFGNQTFHNGDWGRKYRQYNFNYSLLNLGYSGQIAEKVQLSFKAGLRWYDRQYEDDRYNALNLSYQLKEKSGVEQIIFPVDLSMSYNHFNNSNFTVGADYQNASYLTWVHPVTQNKTTGNDAKVTQLGIYIQEELQFKKITVRGGTRYNIISYDISKIGGDIPGSKDEKWDVFLWSAGAKYRVTDKIVVFTNAGNSFMSPSLKSIGGTVPLNEQGVPGSDGQLPNPGLEPESGLSVDLGFEYVLPSDIQLSVRGFNTKITDAIIDNVVSLDPSQTQSVNADGETIAQGFEASIKQNIEHKIEWFANLTYTKSEIKDPDNPDQDGVEVPFVPKLMGKIGFTIYLPYDIIIAPWAHFGGTIYDSSSKQNRNTYESKELINIYLSKALKFKNTQKLDVFIKAYNITNNKFEMPWQFQDTGFNVSIGAQLLF